MRGEQHEALFVRVLVNSCPPSSSPRVASGRYQQAEFAADLWQAHLGEGTDEYRDPVEFFRCTYLTESLKRMLTGAVQRLTGGGGDPVVQLQTNFGGGKTHSMLALYHLSTTGQSGWWFLRGQANRHGLSAGRCPRHFRRSSRRPAAVKLHGAAGGASSGCGHWSMVRGLRKPGDVLARSDLCHLHDGRAEAESCAIDPKLQHQDLSGSPRDGGFVSPTPSGAA